MRWLWFHQIIFIYSFPHFSVFSSFIHLLVIHSLFPFLPLIFPFFLLSLIHSSHFLCNTKLLMDWSTLSPLIDPRAMLCSWALIRTKQLSMAVTTRVIWMCACVRYWPYRVVGTCASVHNFGIISVAPKYSTLYLFVHWYPSRKKINYNPKTL